MARRARASACAPGSKLWFDVFPGDGTTLELMARVDWSEAQPEDGPARYRLGLMVSSPTVPARERLEALLVD